MRVGDGECVVGINAINQDFLAEVLGDKLAFFGPCDYQKWVNLARYKPAQAVVDRLSSLGGNIFVKEHTLQEVNSSIQYLEDAAGTNVNMDYFPVNITQLPPGFTDASFFEHFRENINDFVDTDLSNFQPHPGISGEADKWLDDPLGSIVLIDIPYDDGTVVCTDYSPRSWTFSTIYDSDIARRHPVIGNRQFGITTNPDGSYTIYTRGVDRLTGRDDQLVGTISSVYFGYEGQFAGADALWRSMQEGIVDYINTLGGQATVGQEETKRPNWESVINVLLGKSKEVDCN